MGKRGVGMRPERPEGGMGGNLGGKGQSGQGPPGQDKGNALLRCCRGAPLPLGLLGFGPDGRAEEGSGKPRVRLGEPHSLAEDFQIACNGQRAFWKRDPPTKNHVLGPHCGPEIESFGSLL